MDDLYAVNFSVDLVARRRALFEFSERVQATSPAVLERYARSLEPKSLLDKICFMYDPVRQDRQLAAYELAKQKKETYL